MDMELNDKKVQEQIKELTDKAEESNVRLQNIITELSKTDNLSMSSSNSYNINLGTNSTWPQSSPPFAPTILTGTDSSVWQPCASGHIAEEAKTIEYIDGLAVMFCAVCGTRFSTGSLPGGLTMLQVKALLGAAVALGGKDTDELNLSDILGLFADLKVALAAEERAMNSKRSMMKLAAEVLNKKVNERGKSNA
jgi:hypothetical protein